MTWLKVESFRSKSNPKNSYWVSIHIETQTLGCNCKAWIFKKAGKPRHCKHLDLVSPDTIRSILNLAPNSEEYNTRVTEFIEPDTSDIQHSKQWWMERKIEFI